jgi:hypothetical protein
MDDLDAVSILRRRGLGVGVVDEVSRLCGLFVGLSYGREMGRGMLDMDMLRLPERTALMPESGLLLSNVCLSLIAERLITRTYTTIPNHTNEKNIKEIQRAKESKLHAPPGA